MMDDLSSRLGSAPLTGNSSMAATNTVTSNDGNGALPGSPSESSAPVAARTPMPEIPADRRPSSVVTSGHEGSHSPYGTHSGGGWSVGSDDAGQLAGGWVTP